MRKTLCLFLIIAVLSFAGIALAGKYGIEFVTQKFGTDLTPEEIARIEAEVEAVYPAALDQVTAFVGNEGTRKIFKRLYVAIYDANPEDPQVNAFSNAYEGASHRATQGITLIGPAMINHRIDAKSALVHEMLHTVFEARNDFYDYAAWPTYLHEGISYFGAGSVRNRVLFRLNSRAPSLNLDKILADKENRIYYRERTWLHCFEKVYGIEARKNLIGQLYNGRFWEKAVKKASGEDPDAVLGKCNDCARDYLRGILDAAGPFRETAKAYRVKDDKYAVWLGEKHLAETPDSDWAASTHWKIALAYQRMFRIDEALKHFEILRSNAGGSNALDARAAYQIVYSLIQDGRCEEAATRRVLYERFYPEFRMKWKEDLDNEAEAGCTPDAILHNRGRKYYEHGEYAEAAKTVAQALEARRSAYPDEDERIAESLYLLALSDAKQGKYAEAIPLYEEARAIERDALSPETGDAFLTIDKLADAYASLGRFDEALRVLEDYLSYLRASKRSDDRYIARATHAVGSLFARQGRNAEAEDCFLKALEVYRGVLPKRHAWLSSALLELGRAREAQGRFAEAEESYAECLGIRRAVYPSAHPGLAEVLEGMASVLNKIGRTDEAATAAKEAREMREKYPFTKP